MVQDIVNNKIDNYLDVLEIESVNTNTKSE